MEEVEKITSEHFLRRARAVRTRQVGDMIMQESVEKELYIDNSIANGFA